MKPTITMPAARAIWRLAEEIESLTKGDYTGHASFRVKMKKLCAVVAVI
jgi:hypothetical protein